MCKILFLDADGVINCVRNFDPKSEEYRRSGGYPVDEELIAQVKRIIAETGCEVVLSSAWRIHAEGRAAVQKHIRLLDITPYAHGELMRGREVRMWLQGHPEVERYAILDDNSDFLRFQPLFKTTFDHGLTEDIANKVIAHLNGRE